MYQELNTTQTAPLILKRYGWWNPQYELTDNTKNYGRLSYNDISKRNATVVTATNTWRFNFAKFFSKTILITDQNGAVIGECTRELLCQRRTLTLQSGFSADLYRASFFSREYIWESAGFGKIMSIKNNFPFTLTTDVSIYPTKTPAAIIPIMIFLGEHLIILQRRRRAVH
jgi:hypothetical protein